MVKIDDIQAGRPSEIKQGKKPTDNGEGLSFKDALAKAAGQDESAALAVQAPSTPPPLSINGVNAMPPISPAAGAVEQAVESAERVVSLLEAYQTALGDERVNLKELSGLLSRLEEETDQLSQARRQLPDGDGLDGIIGELETVVAVETVKFNRGDYLG